MFCAVVPFETLSDRIKSSSRTRKPKNLDFFDDDWLKVKRKRIENQQLKQKLIKQNKYVPKKNLSTTKGTSIRTNKDHNVACKGADVLKKSIPRQQLLFQDTKRG